MKGNVKGKKEIKQSLMQGTRDFVRLITVLLFVPWFGWLTTHVFGVELEFESEIAVMISFLLFGSFWCGWICPFGNLSYFISKIGRKLFPGVQITVPEKIDRPLRYLKYLLLLFFIYVIFSHKLDYFFGDHMDMYLSTGATTAFIKFKKYAILLIPLLIPRFFCKYLCFQKAAYNIINRVAPITAIKRDESRCIGCKKCDKACVMNIGISESINVKGNDCIGCYDCLDSSVCPEKADALRLTVMGLPVNPLGLALMVIPFYYFLTWAIL